jgi:multiple sugar transport system substrate-binding protein
MQLAAEQVVRGGIDVEQATRALDRRVDAILEKRRWMLARRKPG